MNSVKARLSDGGEVIGSFVRIMAPEVAELLAFAGFDFVVADGEHALAHDGAIGAVVRAANAAGIPAFVRPPSCEPSVTGRLLESGATGIHLPQVGGPEEASDAIGSVRYPPLGQRGLATGRLGGYGLTMSLPDYVATVNRELLVVCQLDSRVALEHVEEIAGLPGLDVLFIGLTDLTLDLGIPGQYEHPEIVAAVAAARAAAESAGVALGVPVTDVDMLERLRSAGARYFTANDVRLLGAAASEFVRSSRPRG